MQSLMAISDLEVEQIIEKVMIRNTGQPYQYIKHQAKQLTPHEHIWHFQLQEENMNLKKKIRGLKVKCKRREDELKRQEELEKDVRKLRRELEDVLNQNMHLQKDINRVRLRHSRLNESARQEQQGSKSKRQCSCSESKYRGSPQRIKRKQAKLVKVVDSPPRQIIKHTQDVSTNCQIQNKDVLDRAKQKKQRIEQLKQLIQNQQRLISSYQQELNKKGKSDTLQRKNTRPSTSRFQPFNRPTSSKNFKPLSSAGSIVKIRRS